MYLLDWPPLHEIFFKASPFKALPPSFQKFDLSSLPACKFSSAILTLRSDDEFEAVRPVIEKCVFEVVLNMSYVSAALTRLIHGLVLKNKESYIEAQVLRSPKGEAVLVSGDLRLHQALEKALKTISSTVVTASLPPGSLIILKWLLALFSEGLLKFEELLRVAEAFGIKRQPIEKVLRETGFKAQDFNKVLSFLE